MLEKKNNKLKAPRGPFFNRTVEILVSVKQIIYYILNYIRASKTKG